MLKLLGKLCIIAFASCGGAQPESRLKEDITPVGGFGGLKVIAEGVDPATFANYKISVAKSAGTTAVPALAIGSTVQLDSKDKYCVHLKTEASLANTTICDVLIQNGQTTTLTTALVSLGWDTDKLTVDIGPKVDYKIEGARQKIALGLQARMEIGQQYKPFLIFTDDLTISYANVTALAGRFRQFSVVSGQEHTLDITPPDVRTSISIEAEKAKLPIQVATSNYVSSYGIIGHRQDAKYMVPPEYLSLDSAYYSNGSSGAKYSFYSWKELPLHNDSRPETLVYRMYPLIEGIDVGYYAITVSGTHVPLKGGENLVVEPLNVGHINGETPGFFKVNRLDKDKEALLATWDAYYAAPSAEVATPKLGKSFGHFTPTSSSFFVLKGFQYRLDSYMYDDAGVLVRQSSHLLDYL